MLSAGVASLALGCTRIRLATVVDGGEPADAGAVDAAVAVDLAGATVRIALAEIPLDGFISVGDVLAGRDAGGFYALTAICTHEGCLVEVDGAQTTCPGTGPLVCPCHCARYDADGRALAGPTVFPLANLAARREGDELVVELNREVPLGSRTT